METTAVYTYLMSMVGAGMVGALLMLFILSIAVICYMFIEKDKCSNSNCKKESILRGQKEQVCEPLMRLVPYLDST